MWYQDPQRHCFTCRVAPAPASPHIRCWRKEGQEWPEAQVVAGRRLCEPNAQPQLHCRHSAEPGLRLVLHFLHKRLLARQLSQLVSEPNLILIFQPLLPAPDAVLQAGMG